MKTKRTLLPITLGLLISSFVCSGCGLTPLNGLPIQPVVNPTPVINHDDTQTTFTDTDVAIYYAACNGLSGSALSSKLKEINVPKNKSYDWSRYEAADESLTDSTCVISLYTRHNIKKSSHVGSSYSWDKWNREHIYVQATYTLSTTDNHNIFACEGEINNIRNNYKFGTVVHSSSNRVTVSGHQTDCYFDNKYFEPCDEAKGEVARALLYGAITYDYTISGMIDLQTCLNWNSTFTVSQREIKRNNTVFSKQGNRNPFVDNPNYANLIFN